MDHNADPHAKKNDGMTAYHLATINRNVGCIEILEKYTSSTSSVQDTIASMSKLAERCSDMGQYDDAESLYVNCLEITSRSVDQDHLVSMNNLAIFYENIGQFDKAEHLYIQCLEMSTEKLGQDNLDTLVSMINLASHYDSTDQYSKAGPLYVLCLTKQKHILGHDHPYTLRSENFLKQFHIEASKSGASYNSNG